MRPLLRTTAFPSKPFTERLSAAWLAFRTPRRSSSASSTANAVRECSYRCSQECVKGDARSIEVGVRVLVHKADLNGYRAPAKLEIAGKQEMTGKGGGALTLEIVRQFLDATGQEDDEKER